jgi:alpha-beta hydrolase superfamily lysophospholipase
VVHILHGWAEHAARYGRPAEALAAAGFAVYADDHLGHGQTGLRTGTLGDIGPDGIDGPLEAIRDVTLRAAGEHAGAPLFLLGHSWGSFLLQRYLRRWPDDLAGALITGTTYRDPDAPPPARPDFNAAFAPARTDYDWLSRDEAEVDAYVSDPLCGFDAVPLRPPSTPPPVNDEAVIPAGLPIFMFNGADDPVGGAEGADSLAAHYRSVGVTDVTARAYPGGRHELFNETNRDEVVADVIAWLDDRLRRREGGG